MGNTYTQIHVQFVFAVKFREALIHESWEDRLYRYITGTVQNNKHKLLAVNGMSDHVHLFVGLHPNQSVSELMRVVKGESSEWINKEKLTPKIFRWQEGFGGFSYSHSHIDKVVNYIHNQKKHHQKNTFLEEYKGLLTKFEIEYKDEYLLTSPL